MSDVRVEAEDATHDLEEIGVLDERDLDKVSGGTRPFMPVDGESTDDKHKGEIH